MSDITSVELNLARHISRRFKLTPPLTHTLLNVVEYFADVEIGDLPVKVDGACLKRQGERPTILINKRQIETRKLFTLAHEFGHVLIPTHYGTIVDEFVDGFDYSPTEAQANRFASELLLPLAWAKQFVETTDEPGKLLTTISKRAKVSLSCAAYRLPDILGTGYVFAEISNDNRIKGAISTTYKIAAPQRGAIVREPESRYKTATKQWSFKREDSTYWWWQFDTASPLVKKIETASDILRDIFNDCGVPEEAKQSLRGSIGGVTGGSVKRDESAEQGASRIKEAFVRKAKVIPNYEDKNRVHYQNILRHPRFEEYSKLVASELIAKAYWIAKSD